MSLSDDFNDLAAQFRRIHDVDPAAAQRQIRAASAWGAKLYKRGVGAGVLDSPPGLKWPEPPESIEIDEPSEWQTAWTWLTIVYEYCLPTEVPSNLVAARYERRQSPDSAAVIVGKFEPSDWRIRAEKYAAFAKLLADGTAEVQASLEPPVIETPAGKRRIEVDTARCRVRVENTWYDVTTKQTDIFDLLISTDGEYASLADNNLRSREIGTLPKELQSQIETKAGTGTRIPRERLWLS